MLKFHTRVQEHIGSPHKCNDTNSDPSGTHSVSLHTHLCVASCTCTLCSMKKMTWDSCQVLQIVWIQITLTHLLSFLSQLLSLGDKTRTEWSLLVTSTEPYHIDRVGGRKFTHILGKFRSRQRCSSSLYVGNHKNDKDSSTNHGCSSVVVHQGQTTVKAHSLFFYCDDGML